MYYHDRGYQGLVELHNFLNTLLHDDSILSPGAGAREGMRRADLNARWDDLDPEARENALRDSDAEIRAYGERVSVMLYYARLLYAAVGDVIDRDDYMIKHLEHYIRRDAGLDKTQRAKLLRATRGINNKVRMCFRPSAGEGTTEDADLDGSVQDPDVPGPDGGDGEG